MYKHRCRYIHTRTQEQEHIRMYILTSCVLCMLLPLVIQLKFGNKVIIMELCTGGCLYEVCHVILHNVCMHVFCMYLNIQVPDLVEEGAWCDIWLAGGA